MKPYQILDWDTRILGIPTAKILTTKLTTAELAKTLKLLKEDKIGLVFWASDSADVVSQQAAEEFDGFLADKKITYHQDLTNFQSEEFDISQVESYLEILPTAEMHQIALEIAAFSRFSTDPKISNEQMLKVYKTWLENSTKRNIAKEVLVIRDHEKVIGMTTLGEKNNRGDIGLIGVDPQHRGRNLGSTLVRASQIWSQQNGYRWTQVVTQRTNPGACKLYEKCGYTIDKIENFYHFWL